MTTGNGHGNTIGPHVADRTLIVGASLAGVAVAEELRVAGYVGEIVLLGDEDEMPYDRPPLSKQWLLAPADRRVQPQPLKDPKWYADNRITLLLGARAERLSPRENGIDVHVRGRDPISATRVVIACGARARNLTAAENSDDPPGPQPNYLRTVGDARRFRADLQTRRGRVMVVGAGFIGLEAASAAHKLGWEVTILEQSSSPLSRVLPPAVADACLRGLPHVGVTIRPAVSVTSYRSEKGRNTIVLDSGEEVTGDAIVVGIGTIPNTEWLHESGISCDGGVLCDSQGRTSVPHVWAAGDVARWHDGAGVRQPRSEQWQSAREQARVVARSITGDDPRWTEVPYFWSEIFGVRIQMCGVASPAMSTYSIADGNKELLLLVDENYMLAGAVALNSPRWMGISKKWLSAGLSLTQCQSHTAQLSPKASIASRERNDIEHQ